jgi:hypothetical protein
MAKNDEEITTIYFYWPNIVWQLCFLDQCGEMSNS